MGSVRRVRKGVIGGVAGAALLVALLIVAGSAAGQRQSSAPGAQAAGSGHSATAHASKKAKRARVKIRGNSNANYRFVPRNLRVRRGTKVIWSWRSNEPHNVVFTSSGKHSATGLKGTYRLRFKRRGTFRYVCTVHGFSGKVIVR